MAALTDLQLRSMFRCHDAVMQNLFNKIKALEKRIIILEQILGVEYENKRHAKKH